MIVASEIKDTLDYSLPKTKKIIATYIPNFMHEFTKKERMNAIVLFAINKKKYVCLEEEIKSGLKQYTFDCFFSDMVCMGMSFQFILLDAKGDVNSFRKFY